MKETPRRLKLVGKTMEVNIKDIGNREDWVETSEAAQILKGSYSVIRKYIGQGKIHFTKESSNRMLVYRPDITEIAKSFAPGKRKRNGPILTREGYDCNVTIATEKFRFMSAIGALSDKTYEQMIVEYIDRGINEDKKKGFKFPDLSEKKTKKQIDSER